MVIDAQDGVSSVSSGVALVVDLDGTLTPADTLHEGLARLLLNRPLTALHLPGWLRAGKAGFKREVARRAPFDASSIPYDERVLDQLRTARAAGRRTVLATASDEAVAHAVANHLGLFDEVIASDGSVNCSGAAKRDALVARFGAGGFDYIGDSPTDLPVWSQARTAILTNGARSLAAALDDGHDNVETLSPRPGFWRNLVQAGRLYQWVKNVLVFVPILAAQQLDAGSVAAAALAFLFFSLAASGVYMINDLLDLEADRGHPRKRNRPFAAGRLGVLRGLAIAALLIFVSLAGGFALAVEFALVLLAYLAATSAYSLWIKRQPLIDVVVLAALYTLRVIAGGAATGTELSLWLLAFAMFLFASLAFAKRYAEVTDTLRRGESEVGGRGYRAGDQNVLMALGTACGLASVVTLALFVNNPTEPALYGSPAFLWGLCPVVLYWMAHIWLAAQRGTLTDDPIVFAFRDRVSRAALAVAVLPVALAIWL